MRIFQRLSFAILAVIPLLVPTTLVEALPTAVETRDADTTSVQNAIDSLRFTATTDHRFHSP